MLYNNNDDYKHQVILSPVSRNEKQASLTDPMDVNQIMKR